MDKQNEMAVSREEGREKTRGANEGSNRIVKKFGKRNKLLVLPFPHANSQDFCTPV